MLSNINEKNVSDVSILQMIIEQQEALGGKVPVDLNDDCYTWDENGRLARISWGNSKNKLQGNLSIGELPALTTLDCSGNLVHCIIDF